MSNDYLHHITFRFHIINPFFDHLFCSMDQWIIGIHDPSDWCFLIGLIKNQCNFIDKLQLFLGLWRFCNIIADLLPETPYFLAALVKADSDYGFNRVEKINFLESIYHVKHKTL